MSHTKKGLRALQDYYRQIYLDEWDRLYETLIQEKIDETYVCVEGADLKNMSIHDNTSPRTNNLSYKIDIASYLASEIAYNTIQTLDVSPRILDMCAAPGGKALALLHKLRANFQNTWFFLLNEKSSNRFWRLKRNIAQYFSTQSEISEFELIFSNIDASIFGKNHKEHYDFVMLDAPCSNTRHVLEDNKALEQWNYKHNRRLAIQQTSLLCAGIDACKEGGFILYMTCSIDPLENEALISKVLKKRNVSVVSVDMQDVLATSGVLKDFPHMGDKMKDAWHAREHGVLCLPQKHFAVGPLFLCVLQKQEVEARKSNQAPKGKFIA